MLGVPSEFLDSHGFEECDFVFFFYLILDKSATALFYKEHCRNFKKENHGNDIIQRKDVPFKEMNERREG